MPSSFFFCILFLYHLHDNAVMGIVQAMSFLKIYDLFCVAEMYYITVQQGLFQSDDSQPLQKLQTGVLCMIKSHLCFTKKPSLCGSPVLGLDTCLSFFLACLLLFFFSEGFY
jgi:hypothetical protein